VLVIALVALVLGEAAGVLVWIADSHYDRGQKAFAMGVYDTAADEFAAARILVFPYGNAAAMERAARAALDKENAVTRAEQKVQAQLLATLGDAGKRLAAGDAAGVLVALRSARAQVPHGPLSDAPVTRRVATDLHARLLAAARTTLAKAHWHRAWLYASGVLLLDPADAKAAAITRKAKADEVLQGRLGTALAAAGAHKWRHSLALALAVLHARPGFPGAANLVRRARVALRPKAKPRPAAVTTASTAGRVAPTTPSAPQPPPP